MGAGVLRLRISLASREKYCAQHDMGFIFFSDIEGVVNGASVRWHIGMGVSDVEA